MAGAEEVGNNGGRFLDEEYSHDMYDAAMKKVDRIMVVFWTWLVVCLIGATAMLSFLDIPFFEYKGIAKIAASAAVVLVVSVPGFFIGRLSGMGSGWHEIAMIFYSRGRLYRSKEDILKS